MKDFRMPDSFYDPPDEPRLSCCGVWAGDGEHDPTCKKVALAQAAYAELYGQERCKLCSEPWVSWYSGSLDAEAGEFVQKDRSGSVKHVLAHAQCGLDLGLELA